MKHRHFQPSPDAAHASPASHLYGRQPIQEVIRAGRRRVVRLYVQDGVRAGPEMAEVAAAVRKAGGEIQPADKRLLDRLTMNGHHQGVVLEAATYPYVALDEIIAQSAGQKDPLWLLLDHLMDPHNVGALLRTAEAAGVTGVVIPVDRAVEITDAVVRASAGAAEHVRVARVTNLVRAMKELQEHGIWMYGLESLPEAKRYTEVDYSGGVGLVLGSEGEGLGRLVRETCDFLVQIPLRGLVNSLNVSVAGALALYEVVRQRGQA